MRQLRYATAMAPGFAGERKPLTGLDRSLDGDALALSGKELQRRGEASTRVVRKQ